MVDIKTPVMLITGSLGSGKTTLLRHILDMAAISPEIARDRLPGLALQDRTGGRPPGGPDSQLRIAVLMNEFGELAIDSRVIGGRNIDIIELSGGCVCCSMTGEFEAAVREIIETIGPDFIVVEATGVAESDALVFEVEDNLPEVRLDSVICIVDAYLGVKHPYVGYTSRTQIASADIILINKADLVTQAEAEAVEALTREHNDHAVFLRTVNCGVDPDLLFGQGPRHKARPFSFQSEIEFDSISWTSERVLDRTKFDELVSELPVQLIRAKGFVRFAEGGRLFNYVAGRVDFEEFDVAGTELVFIGADLKRVFPEIENRLDDCRV
jgi:G3E family GTPase